MYSICEFCDIHHLLWGNHDVFHLCWIFVFFSVSECFMCLIDCNDLLISDTPQGFTVLKHRCINGVWSSVVWFAYVVFDYGFCLGLTGLSQQFHCDASVIICIKYAQLHFLFSRNRVQIPKVSPSSEGWHAASAGLSDSWSSNSSLINYGEHRGCCSEIHCRVSCGKLSVGSLSRHSWSLKVNGIGRFWENPWVSVTHSASSSRINQVESSPHAGSAKETKDPRLLMSAGLFGLLFSTTQTSQTVGLQLILQHRHSRFLSQAVNRPLPPPACTMVPTEPLRRASCADRVFFRMALKDLLWHFYLSNFLAILVQKSKVCLYWARIFTHVVLVI